MSGSCSNESATSQVLIRRTVFLPTGSSSVQPVRHSASRSTIITLFARHKWELVGCGITLLFIPLLLAWLWRNANSYVSTLGLESLLERSNGLGWTDIGWAVASSAGLLQEGLSPYDPLSSIGPLIGMPTSSLDVGIHTHPPTSLVLWLPLTLAPYTSWIAFWMVASVLMIAWSMRLLGVPVYLAYPIAIAVSLSPPGRWALFSSYCLSALLIALAWRLRLAGRSGAGVVLGVFAAIRGVGVIMLLDLVLNKRWRSLILGIITLTVLVAFAVLLQPNVIWQWLTVSRDEISVITARPDLITPASIFDRLGIPILLLWLLLGLVAVLAIRRGSNSFWVLNWLVLALSPIAWFHASIQAIPLLTMLWKAGRFGHSLVLVVAASALVSLADPITTAVPRPIWPVTVFVIGLGLVVLPVGESQPTRAPQGV